jgi:hypothetical protein
MGLDDVFGSLADDHQRYITELALAMGLRGLSYYVFVERDDVQYAPISPIGKVRPRLKEVSKAIALASAMRSDEQLRDIGLLWSLDHHRLAIARRFDDWQKLYHLWIDMDVPKELPAWWSVFSSLHEADVDFSILPMQSDVALPILVYAGPGAVRVSDWEAVTRRVEEGATLIARDLPSEALFGEPAEAEALNRRIEATGRLLPWGDEPLPAVLGRAGARWAIRSSEPGVWSTAYRMDDALVFFALNPGEEERSTTLLLGELAGSLATGAPARNLENGAEWQVPGETLVDGSVTLAPKQVLAVEVRSAGATPKDRDRTSVGVTGGT